MEMVEVKVSELSGAALDWAVAKTQGFSESESQFARELGFVMEKITQAPNPYDGWALGKIEKIQIAPSMFRCGLRYMPSANWSQGGPLIEKYGLLFEDHIGLYGCWVAEIKKVIGAETHLIAACRAIVAAKLGETVSVPRELLP